MFEWWEYLIGAVIALVLAGTVTGVGYAIYDGVTAETFELRKDAFYCTKSHTETSGYFMQVGTVQQWVPTTSTVCDQWTRR